MDKKDAPIPAWRGIRGQRITPSTPVLDWPTLMTTKEVAIATGMSYRTVCRRQAEGAIRTVPGTNRRRLTEKSEVLRWITRGAEEFYASPTPDDQKRRRQSA